MDYRTASRLSMGTGIVVVLALGVSVTLLTGFGADIHPWWLWWTAYVVYVVAFLLADDDLLPRLPRWARPRVLLGVQLVSGVVAWFTSATVGWTSVLLVVSAATAAYVVSARATVAVVAVQTLAVAVGAAIAGLPAGHVVLSTAVYACFQAFAALVVLSQRREAEARSALAVAHAELRATYALLDASARDAERLRISRELHDLVGHQLTALSLELEVASHLATPPADQHVRRARSVARDLLGDVRAAVGRLRRPDQGLAATLQRMVTSFPGLDVHLDVQEEVSLDADRTLTVIRCVQEAITNTVRHAEARNLWVRVRADAAGLRVEAWDDGRGADRVVPGNGLRGMRERLEQLGGHLVVDGGGGRGFRLAAEVPAP